MTSKHWTDSCSFWISPTALEFNLVILFLIPEYNSMHNFMYCIVYYWITRSLSSSCAFLKLGMMFYFVWHCVCVCTGHFRVFATLTVPCQAPPSMGFPRQEPWSRLPFSSPGDFPNPGTEPTLLYLLHWQVDSLPLVLPGKPIWHYQHLTKWDSHSVKASWLNWWKASFFKNVLEVGMGRRGTKTHPRLINEAIYKTYKLDKLKQALNVNGIDF